MLFFDSQNISFQRLLLINFINAFGFPHQFPVDLIEIICNSLEIIVRSRIKLMFLKCKVNESLLKHCKIIESNNFQIQTWSCSSTNSV